MALLWVSWTAADLCVPLSLSGFAVAGLWLVLLRTAARQAGRMSGEGATELWWQVPGRTRRSARGQLCRRSSLEVFHLLLCTYIVVPFFFFLESKPPAAFAVTSTAGSGFSPSFIVCLSAKCISYIWRPMLSDQTRHKVPSENDSDVFLSCRVSSQLISVHLPVCMFLY